MVKQNSANIGDRNGGTWGTVRQARTGFVIETHSRYQGTRTGERVLVPFTAANLPVARDEALTAKDDQGVSNAQYVTLYASRYPERCRVLARGYAVQ